MRNSLNKIALVQCYLKHKTDLDVDIRPPENLRQSLLLDTAYNVALKFFNL